MQFKSVWFQYNYTVLFYLHEIFKVVKLTETEGRMVVARGLKVKVAQLRQTLCDSMVCSPPGSSVHGILQARILGVGCHSLLQGIFPTQRSNPGLSHCRRVLYCLSQQGSPRILEWGAYPFSGELPNTGIEPWSSALQVDSLLAELPGPWEEGKMESCPLRGIEFQFCKMKKLRRLDAKQCINLTLLNCTFKTVNMDYGKQYGSSSRN